MTKEQAYDTLINPLMAQIIAICKEHQIPMVATYELGDDLECTSALSTKEWGASKKLAHAIRVIMGEVSASPMMITEFGPDGEAKSMTAII